MEGMNLLTKQVLPHIQLPSPILALADDEQGGVWAGGMGGVAHFDPEHGWTPMISGLPLSGVSGFAVSSQWLFAGGVEGIARFSRQSGEWQSARIEGNGNSIAALALSPDFEQDRSALAASLASGILRSEDAGATWRSSNFGVQNFEVTSLAWASSGHAFAGTASGIFRSPNGGRAWRSVDDTFGMSIAAIVILPNDQLLAVTDDGLLLISSDNGASWQAHESNLPVDIVPTACIVYSDQLLLCSSGAGSASGLFRSLNGGHYWQRIVDEPIFCLTASGDALYVGTGRGLIGSADGGQTWQSLPLSPLHDLRRITVAFGQVIISGGYSVALRTRNHQMWEPLLQIPLPLSLLRATRNGLLFASGPDGLLISDDVGDHWQQVLVGEQGHIRHLALREDGKGWAASADSRRLLRTTDGGLHWEVANSPFGADPIVALEAAADMLFAATYSQNQQIARLWYSHDDGLRWNRGAEARTSWAGVATYSQPPMVSLGNTILARQGDERWQMAQLPPDSGLVRRIIGNVSHLLALTTGGILISTDNAASFAPLEGIDLPTDQIMDIALDGGTLYTLSVDGLVCAFELSA